MSHVLKNIRKCLINNKIIRIPDDVVISENLPSNIVHIDHLRNVEKRQRNLPLKLSKKLTQRSLDSKLYDSMNVKLAHNIFNQATSAAIRELNKHEPEEFGEEYLTTAWFIDFVSKWFKYTNCRDINFALSYTVEDKYLEAIAFLQKVIYIFENIKIGESGAWKPIQKGVKLSTISLLNIHSRILNDKNNKYLLSSNFANDCIENLFSLVRMKHSVPSAKEFKYILRNICIGQFMKEVKNSSYDFDDSEYIINFFKKNPIIEDEEEIMDEEVTKLIPNLDNTKDLTKLDLLVLYYIAGYILSRLMNKGGCEKCLKVLQMNANSKPYNPPDLASFVIEKDFKGDCLIHCCSTIFDEVFVPIEKILRSLDVESFYKKRKKLMESLISNIDDQLDISVDIPNCCGIKEKLIKRLLKFRLTTLATNIKTVQNSVYASNTMCQKHLAKNIGTKTKNY